VGSARGTWRDGSFNGTLKGMKERLWKRTLLPIGAVFGKLKGPSFAGEFQRATEDGISLRTAPLRNLEVGSFTADFERRSKEKSGNGASLSIEPGKLECGLHYWELRQLSYTCQRQLWKSLSLQRLCEENLEGGLISCGI